MEKQLNIIESKILECLETMKHTDERALKCFKLGLDFRTTYPEEYTLYVNAREKYNELEIERDEIKRLIEEENGRRNEENNHLGDEYGAS